MQEFDQASVGRCFQSAFEFRDGVRERIAITNSLAVGELDFVDLIVRAVRVARADEPPGVVCRRCYRTEASTKV